MPPPAPRNPRRNRILFGCLGLFTATSLCFFASLAGLFWYMFATPAQVPIASVVGPETVAVLRVRGDMSDPGVAALMGSFADALNAMQASSQPQLPQFPWMQPLQAWNNRRSIGYIVPKEAGVIVEQIAGGTATGTVFVMSPRQLPRFYVRGLSWAFSRAPGSVVTHRGSATIIQADPTSIFAVARGTLLFGSSLDALHAVVDRIESAPAGSGVGLRLASLGTELDGEAVVRAGAPVAPDARSCEMLAATIDIVDADRIDARFDADCSAGSPDERAAFIEECLAAIRTTLPGALQLTAQAEPTASGIGGSAELAGLGTWLGSVLAPPGPGGSTATPAATEPADPAVVPEAPATEEEPGSLSET